MENRQSSFFWNNFVPLSLIAATFRWWLTKNQTLLKIQIFYLPHWTTNYAGKIFKHYRRRFENLLWSSFLRGKKPLWREQGTVAVHFLCFTYTRLILYGCSTFLKPTQQISFSHTRRKQWFQSHSAPIRRYFLNGICSKREIQIQLFCDTQTWKRMCTYCKNYGLGSCYT